jgi:hypothetical protein
MGRQLVRRLAGSLEPLNAKEDIMSKVLLEGAAALITCIGVGCMCCVPIILFRAAFHRNKR